MWRSQNGMAEIAVAPSGLIILALNTVMDYNGYIIETDQYDLIINLYKLYKKLRL
ncbi:hypothetical protein J7L67_08555 [bacterium]|nr:hypothetical protein [bacterium]